MSSSNVRLHEHNFTLCHLVHWSAGTTLLNTLRPRQNGRHLPDDIFKCILLNAIVWIVTKMSLKFVPKSPISNIPALAQIMAWGRPSDKPLSAPMVVILLTHIWVTRPHWTVIQHSIALSIDEHERFTILINPFVKLTFVMLHQCILTNGCSWERVEDFEAVKYLTRVRIEPTYLGLCWMTYNFTYRCQVLSIPWLVVLVNHLNRSV